MMQTNGFRARAWIGAGFVTVPAAQTHHVVRWLALWLTAVVAIGALASAVDRQRSAAAGAVSAGSPASADTSSVVDTYGRLPMIFEANAGQADPSVLYVTRGAGYTLSLTEREAVLSLIADEESGRTAVVRMATVGSAASPAISGVDPQSGRVNYLTGDDPSAWRTDVPTFGGVRYTGVYPGIDLVYYGNQQQLEYDFVVAPRADPTVIRLAFTGADGLRLSEGGDLVLDVDGRELVQRAPVVYQEVGGSRQTIPSRYLVEGEQITFSLGAYDRSLPLVIDPVIGYSTFLGGSSGEIGYGIAVDSAGNAYIAGQTTSTDFPTVNPFQANHGGDDFDAFVAKLNSRGTALVYATYLGGSGFDQARDIAVDSAGNAYVAGVTSSANFPTVNSVQGTLQGLEDGFVVKLNQAGSALIYGSYLGAAGDDAATAIAVDGSGNAYLTGWTNSVTFPTLNPLQATKGGFVDAFVTKVNAAGSTIVYSTYLGGNLDDLGHGIAVDGTGAAYVAGETLSSNFQTANPLQAASNGRYDGFVTKLNPAGSSLAYSTYLGGSSTDEAHDIALDAAGNAYVTGMTESTDFPTASPLDGSLGGGMDAFVSKLNAAGSALLYSTYLGGNTAESDLSGFDGADGIAVDATGAAHVTGWTQSTDFPLVNAIQPTQGSFQDAFVAKLNAAGSALQHSSYLGGTGGWEAGLAIAVHSSAAAYVTGETDSTDFPTTSGALQEGPPNEFGGSAFVTKLTYGCSTAPFNDVLTTHPFCVEIEWMKDNDISTGFSDGTYRPAIAVTRQAMSAFMARLADASLPACSTAPFNDVLTTHPFCAEIKWMKDEDISTGFSDGTYRPSIAVTRQAMSAFMARLAGGSLTACSTAPFSDVPTTHPFCAEIKWMKDNAISTGFSDGTYRPSIAVTRQAMSAFMARVSLVLP